MPAEAGLNRDFRDLLDCLLASDVRFLVVGAHALAALGVPRATGDLDVWVEPTAANADRVWAALTRFGAPVAELGVTRSDFASAGVVVQLGLPPRRIDLLTELTGIAFDEAWLGRAVQNVDGLLVPFLGRRDFVRNKRATGRTRDLADLEALGEIPER
jgi:hypothetical protein